jgi:hypothetical protein
MGRATTSPQMIKKKFRIPVLAVVLLALASCAAFAGPRADALGVDGIYHGQIGMQLDTPKGKNLNYKAKAKLVVMPDGTGAILTAQHPDGVVSLAIKGAFKGNVFYSESKGKLDYGGYHWGMVWDITFDAKKGTAVLHGKPINRPKWAKDDDDRYVFRKQPGKPK